MREYPLSDTARTKVWTFVDASTATISTRGFMIAVTSVSCRFLFFIFFETCACAQVIYTDGFHARL